MPNIRKESLNYLLELHKKHPEGAGYDHNEWQNAPDDQRQMYSRMLSYLEVRGMIEVKRYLNGCPFRISFTSYGYDTIDQLQNQTKLAFLLSIVRSKEVKIFGAVLGIIWCAIEYFSNLYPAEFRLFWESHFLHFFK